ncbi:MAG: hypothetical protein NVS1B13_22520 [Flavisolibacter sp.]
MVYNQQLNFLQGKIREIGTAIFFNLSESVLKLPTSLVHTLNVDDYGYVWFFVKRPKQQLKEFENEFPVRLDFFRKGTSHFLQVSGKAWVVNDPEQINSFSDAQEGNTQSEFQSMVLVKVKIMKAEYYESKTANNNSWLQDAFSAVTTWFRSNHYRPDTYFPASQI